MTNQEAITKLTNIMHDDHYAWHPSVLEAFRMAVDALKGANIICGACEHSDSSVLYLTNPPKVQCRKTGNLHSVTDSCECIELPSAQPTHGNASNALKSLDCIDRQAAIDEIKALYEWHDTVTEDRTVDHLKRLPSAQPEYEPVTAEDLAKTMSENTLYSFMAWHGEALALMKEQGFVICKKTM